MNSEAKNKIISIGYGESEDPLPGRSQITRYKVFAGPCKECGCAGRKIFPIRDILVIVCDQCHSEQITSIPASDMSEVTYVYWCNSSRFISDMVELDQVSISEIEKLLEQIPCEHEVPRWAVAIVSGRCSSSEQCVNFSCPYLKKSQ